MKIAKVLKGTLAAVILAGSFAIAPAAHAAVFVSVGIAPPPIPVYEQPLAPGYGYIWTPGYWAWGDGGYYWVDGAWVYPPYEDALWTPGYWDWDASYYYWNPGYWGRTIGYYGGINYGFGYFGTGFYGGYWNGGHFFYNSEYNHIGFRDHDHDRFVYNQRVNGFDGRPGGAAFVHDDHRNTARGDFNRGGTVNGRDFGNRGGNGLADRGNNAGRGNEQVNFRNGYNANGARPEVNNNAGFRGDANRPAGNNGSLAGRSNEQVNFRNGYNGNGARPDVNQGATVNGNAGRQSF
ncbi:MAG TPA: colicin transporter, partial [Acidobacteriaceae bacterium]